MLLSATAIYNIELGLRLFPANDRLNTTNSI